MFAGSVSQRAVLFPCCAWRPPMGGGHVSRDLWGGSASAQPQGGAPTASRGTVTRGAQRSVCLSTQRTGRQALLPWACGPPRGRGAGMLTAPGLRSHTAGSGRGPPSGCPRLGLPPARSLQQQEARKGRVKEAAWKGLARMAWRRCGAWGLRPAPCHQCLGGGTWEALGLCLNSSSSHFGMNQGRFTSRTFFQPVDGLLVGGEASGDLADARGRCGPAV